MRPTSSALDFEIDNRLWPGDGSVSARHGILERTRDTAAEAIVLVEQSSVPTHFSSVLVDNREVLRVEWEPLLVAPHFAFHLESSSGVGFFGAGRISATVRIDPPELLELRAPYLFWSYERREGGILELGELECHLHSRAGERIATVPCDPPYELHEEELGIRVISPVFGSHLLRYGNQERS